MAIIWLLFSLKFVSLCDLSVEMFNYCLNNPAPPKVWTANVGTKEEWNHYALFDMETWRKIFLNVANKIKNLYLNKLPFSSRCYLSYIQKKLERGWINFMPNTKISKRNCMNTKDLSKDFFFFLTASKLMFISNSFYSCLVNMSDHVENASKCNSFP